MFTPRNPGEMVPTGRGCPASGMEGWGALQGYRRQPGGAHRPRPPREPHLVEAQLRLIPLILVGLPFRLGRGLAAVGGLVRLALGQAAARVRVGELRVLLLAATAGATTAGGRQHEALPDQQLDGIVQADVIVKQRVAVLHLQGHGTRSADTESSPRAKDRTSPRGGPALEQTNGK